MADTVHQGAGTTTDERHRLPVKTLISASIGNAVEWFDWTVYATFVVYFAGQFFPAENEALALIGATSTYALAFFFRPLGGILLGRFADLRGRKAGMLLTILLMAGGSMVIAILPTYEQVGWLAPVLLLLARIAQGMSLGGEVSNASAYLGEIAPPAHRGRYSSFFYVSTGSALLAASLLGVLLTRVLDEDQLNSYGWRIAFFIGGLLGLIGMWLRRSLVETEQFEESAEKARATKHPLLQTIKYHPKAVVQLCAFTLLSTLSYYTFFSALTPFAIKFRGADDNDVFLALSIGTALFVALCYPFGALSDRFGRKPQMLVWSGGYALLIVPLSFLVRDNLLSLIVVFCTGLGLYALLASIAPAVMSELFPTELRATGIGAWYNLTVALFGGTAPLVITALSEAGHPLWFFWYVAIAAAVAFAVILTLKETKGTELR
ncbi:MAG TPA: MFS transporter [Geodermatophilus sp.]|jgi:MFS transporter, MHS family, alpha-ketoglutarate permease|nr:MFS transporter [Geodermatophilus sp.]